MKYISDDGKEFESEKACKIYEAIKKYKAKQEPVITKVNSIIINVEMSDGLSHSIVYQGIKDNAKISMTNDDNDKNILLNNNINKATINFDYVAGSMIIV